MDCTCQKLCDYCDSSRRFYHIQFCDRIKKESHSLLWAPYRTHAGGCDRNQDFCKLCDICEADKKQNKQKDFEELLPHMKKILEKIKTEFLEKYPEQEEILQKVIEEKDFVFKSDYYLMDTYKTIYNLIEECEAWDKEGHIKGV
jgi:hypothetical protein